MIEIILEDDDFMEEEDVCIICGGLVFNYPQNWASICNDCWYGYGPKKKIN